MKEFTASLSSFDYAAIEAQAESFKMIQDTEDPPSVVDMIPLLNIEDIDKSGVEYPIEELKNAYGTSATLISHSIDGSPGKC